MKKKISGLLIVAILVSALLSTAVLAAGQSESREDYETLLDNYIKKNHADLMMDDSAYSYCIFYEEVNDDSWDSKKLRAGLWCTDHLMGTNSKPDKDKYMEVLMTMLVTYDQDNAEKVLNQNKNDLLKTWESYLADGAELLVDIPDFFGDLPFIPEFDEEFSLVLDVMSTSINNMNDRLNAFLHYKTLVQDYTKYDAILKEIENSNIAEDDLKEAAKDLRFVMSEQLHCMLQAMADSDSDVLKNESEFLFTNGHTLLLKNSKHYTENGVLGKFVKKWGKVVPIYKVLKLMKESAMLAANGLIGYEDLVNRYAEVEALVKIDAVLKDRIESNKDAYVSADTKEEKREYAEKMMEYSEVLLGNRIRGEYCIYSICEHDANFMGEVMKLCMERDPDKKDPFEEYYEHKTKVILELDSDIQSINDALEGYIDLETYTGPLKTDIRRKDTFVYVDEVQALEFTVEGPTGDYSWRTDDPSVVSVDIFGRIQGIKAGTATVTLEANGLTDTIKIDVLEPELKAEDLVLRTGKTERIKYVVSGPDTNVTFSCSDDSIATVDSFGMVTAKEVGSAVITLEANKIKTDIIVTVEEGPSEEDLTMEGIGLPFGHFDGIKPQGDGAIATELDLYDDYTFRLHCQFNPFDDRDCTPYTCTGTFTIDRLNENSDAVLVFQSDKGDFEMTWDDRNLDHEKFFIWVK